MRTLYTLGHSSRTIEYFLDLLQAHGVEVVVDIRTIPRSRHNPQFNQAALKRALKKQKIHYVHFKKLGGLRHTTKASLNTGWHNASFRGFADYMQTAEFRKGLQELMSLGKTKKCALLCAEAVPWRCHRSLVADALTLKKWKVFHIQSKKTAKLHTLTPFLHRVGKKWLYQ